MILFIDCYDSFSYNLSRLVESACSEPVVVCHNDQISLSQLKSYLPLLHAIILGPGPGDPHDPNDSGVVGKVWDLVKEKPVPIFGVCFGYQSMVMNFGGHVQRMSPPQHGQVAKIYHDGTSRIFKGIPSPFEAVRYHSLHAQVDVSSGPKRFDANISPGESIVSTEKENLHQFVPNRGPLRCTASTNSGTHGSTIEMAAEHSELPFFAVQFHPESVLSCFGQQIFSNFWDMACEFNSSRSIEHGSIPSKLTVTHSPLLPETKSCNSIPDLVTKKGAKLTWLQVADALNEFVVLRSAAHPGNWTIFGVLDSEVTRHFRSKNGTVFEGNLHTAPDVTKPNADFWRHTAEFMSKHIVSTELAATLNTYNLPFIGGLVGYVTYEGACQETVNHGKSEDSGMHSDISMVFVDKIITINDQTGELFITGSRSWVQNMENQLQEKSSHQSYTESTSIESVLVTKPDHQRYNEMISKCFEKLEAGDSYELCLTTQTYVDFEDKVNAWDIFTQLVHKNPAPYCSFMNFDDRLIATSPERFLAWDRHSCEFRPIKGTVRKGPDMTLERAKEILSSPKEHAENLMIVDLIRHDVGQLLTKVTTNQLMKVEEYHRVYQLVTSVEGEFNGKQTGIDVLSQSLPPGSMTGAPKQRSVEILRELEGEPRGLYSGVQGYWGIDDRGDWSVIIRSLFQSKDSSRNRWQLGAGGAITVLSTADGEFEEMNTKMESVLNAFVDERNT